MILIKNRKLHALEPDSINFFVGRGSPLGNPFSHLTSSKAKYKVKNLKQSLDYFEVYLEEKIAAKDSAICAELNKIYRAAKYNPHSKICLWCYCWPKDCHAQIIKKVVESKL